MNDLALRKGQGNRVSCGELRRGHYGTGMSMAEVGADGSGLVGA